MVNFTTADRRTQGYSILCEICLIVFFKKYRPQTTGVLFIKPAGAQIQFGYVVHFQSATKNDATLHAIKVDQYDIGWIVIANQKISQRQIIMNQADLMHFSDHYGNCLDYSDFFVIGGVLISQPTTRQCIIPDFFGQQEITSDESATTASVNRKWRGGLNPVSQQI